MPDLQPLFQRAAIIRDAVLKWENTANRVGSLFYDILGQIQTIDSSLSDKFLRKDIDDRAAGNITFEQNIDVLGLAKALNLTVTELATLAKAIVTEIGSATFIPGFDGEGFKIWQAIAGKWHGEFDSRENKSDKRGAGCFGRKR